MSGLFRNVNINEILNQLIKIGEVSTIDPARGTARVTFGDDDSLVSYDLQVLQRNTLHNKDYAMPDIGEDVVCLFLPCGSEDGFILGSVYAGEITPPESDSDQRTVVFSDGTRINYDRKLHKLTATIGKTSIVADQQNVNVVCDGTADIQAGTVNATANAATVKASTIKLTGDVTIDGTLSVSGDVTAQSNVTATGDVMAMGAISLASHMHKDSLNKPTTPPQA